MIKPFYILYQYLIAWPLLAVLTVFTAIFTVCTVHWKNAEFVHKAQQFWSRSFFDRVMSLWLTTSRCAMCGSSMDGCL